MDNQNPNNNPKMPKFNMNWLYVMALVFIVLFFSSKSLDSIFSTSESATRDYTTFVNYINKGYAIFKKVDILSSNEEYYIVKKNTKYGLSVYDHILLDTEGINEGDFIYR